MPDYATGPGRHGRGPVIAAYAETGAIDCHCPNCRAKPGDWCTHADGTPRKIPCPRRLPHLDRPAATGSDETPAAGVTGSISDESDEMETSQ